MIKLYSARVFQPSQIVHTNQTDPSSECVYKKVLQVSLESANLLGDRLKPCIAVIQYSNVRSGSFEKHEHCERSYDLHPLDYWWYENKWMFKKVQVLSADSQLRVNLCPVEEMLDKDVSIKYV